MEAIAQASVRRVQAALREAGSTARIVELAASARSAEEAAAALGVEPSAIVKSLVFLLGGEPVMALVAGDRRCVEAALPAALGRTGAVTRANAAAVREVTGFAIGGVSPVGLARPMPIVIDAGLARNTTIYAAAGHPFCVFPTTMAELAAITGGTISAEIAAAAKAPD